MKRRILHLSMALGAVIWLWVGSYVLLREFQFNRTAWVNGLVVLRHGGHTYRSVSLPEALRPLKPAYDQLARIDRLVTGERVTVYVGNENGGSLNFTTGYQF